jgi:hypothetical protein
MEVVGEHRSLKVQKLVSLPFKRESEWISGGDFRVKSVKLATLYGKPAWKVDIEQVGSLVSPSSKKYFL